jgi:hypothetical protein
VAYPSAPGVCSDDISKVSMSSRYQKFPGKAGGNPGQTFQISSQSGDWSGKSKVDVSVVAPGNENMKGFVVVAEDMQGNRYIYFPSFSLRNIFSLFHLFLN